MIRREAKRSSTCVVLALVLGLAVAACGGGSGSSSGSITGGGTEEASSGSSEAATAKAELAKLHKGEYGKPDPEAPEHKAGENVWAIVTGFESVGAKLEGEEFEAGAEELGWDPTLKDGKFDPSVELSAVREAVQAHAAAIWLESVDCESIRAGLQEAKEAGVIVVASNSRDCAQPLFSAEVNVLGAPSAYAKRVGEGQAIWAIADTDAEAKVLLVHETDFAAAKEVNAAAKQRFEQCAGCELVGEVTFVGTELGPALQQKVEQALLKYPETTVVDGNYDAAVELGIAAAVRSSGKDIAVLGNEGQPNNIEMVRHGEQAMGVGYPFGWIAYAGLDTIIRFLAGEGKVTNSGAGLQVYDAEHNLPPKGQAFKPPVDFKRLYREAWALG